MTAWLQKPSAGHTKYTPEYKQQALEQWRLSGRSAVYLALRHLTLALNPGVSR